MSRKPLIFLAILTTLLAGCRPGGSRDTREVITVTVVPFAYFAEQLAGDHFRINVLIPPGASHHNYDPTPRQLEDLENSKALFIDGYLGFELSWVPRFRSNYKDLLIVDLSRGVDLITTEAGEGGEAHAGETGEEDHDHGGVDPHYWLSITEARKLAANMAAGLEQADPAFGETVKANLAVLTKRLDSLGNKLAQDLGKLNHRDFLIFHPALTYLSRDYHLSQHSMESGGKEPSAAHIRNLVDLARKDRINTIFIQKEYDQENALTLSREIGAKIVVIDPMAPDWFSEMENLGMKLKEMDNR
jgi:zinc transport system substrate-binding protein